VDTAQANYRLIRDAYRSLNKKNFNEAILILERVLASGYGDIYVLLLLSVAYLYTGQFGKLARFITKMKEMDPSYMPLVQLEAFLKLKSAATREDALKVYIELAARHPSDAHIHRGRRLVSEARDFAAFQKDTLLSDFISVTRPPRALRKKAHRKVFTGTLGKRGIKIRKEHTGSRRLALLIVVVALLLVAAASVWLLSGSGLMRSIVSRGGKPAGDTATIDLVTISGTEYDLTRSVRRGTVPVFYQSARDMTVDFNRARTMIKNGRYNDALYVLNGIAASNINFVVKEKVEFLVTFVINQEDRDFEEVPFRTMSESTYRYRGYAVRWRGRVEGVKERDESQIAAVEISTAAGEPAGSVDIYYKRLDPALAVDSRVVMEGVIMDFIGKEKRPYLAVKSVKVLSSR
jgi:hypothetical protein